MVEGAEKICEMLTNGQLEEKYHKIDAFVSIRVIKHEL